MSLSLLAIFGILLSSTCLIVALIAFIYGKQRLHKIWALFNLCVAIWGLGMFFIGDKNLNKEGALFFWKFAHIGGMFIPVVFLHTMLELCSIRKRKFLSFFYAQALFFVILTLNNRIGWWLEYIFNSFYWVKPLGYPYVIATFLWFGAMGYGFIVLIKEYIKSKGLKRNQYKYLLVAMLIGFVGGASHFFPVYGINIYPFNITIVFYTLIVTYAILKHHLLDIRIAVTRAGIFAFVYAFILGLPLLLGVRLHNTNFIQTFWYIPVILGLVLATLGPIIYNYLRRQAEEIILKEQKHYQEALQQLAQGLKEIKKEKDKLLKTVAKTIKDEVKPEYVTVYTHHQGKKEYGLYCRYPDNPGVKLLSVAQEGEFVKMLKRTEGSIISEDTEIDPLHQEKLIVPIFVRGGLFGFLVLGPKLGKRMYTPEDIGAFNLLSSHVSLAMENCLFWEEESRNERLRRMQSMDSFSASMAHEIENPLFGAECALMRLQTWMKKRELEKKLDAEEQAMFAEKLGASLGNMGRIHKMIKAVRAFSNKDSGELSVLEMKTVIEDYVELIMPQINSHSVDFNQTVEAGVNVYGNKIYLEEALFNLTSNAIHAVSENKEAKKISLKVYKTGAEMFRIELRDNGYGISKENNFQEDIFLDFVTTKASTVGTGMGLPRVRKIVEMHGGRIWAESEGEGKGAAFIIELPAVNKRDEKEGA